AAAAAVLLLVGLPHWGYERGLARHEAALVQAREQVAAVETERAQAHRHAAEGQNTLVRTTAAQHLRVQVLAPAGYQAVAPNPHRVAVTDLNGHPVEARLTARVLGEDGRELFQTQEIAAQGTLVVSLPGNLATPGQGLLRLDMEARSHNATSYLS